MIKLIGLDFDETLAPTERYYRRSEREFLDLLAKRGMPQKTLDKIQENFTLFQKQNIPLTGFGASLQLKTFFDLSTRFAPKIVDADLSAGITQITEKLRNHPVMLYKDVRGFFKNLRDMGISVAVITKGEHFHQKSKLQTLKDKFRDANLAWDEFILGDKKANDYATLLRASGFLPQEFVMIGDSVKSDIEPVLELNAHAIWLNRPSHNKVKWAYEKSDVQEGCSKVKNLDEASIVIQNLVNQSSLAR